jgi:hypothetical protein
MVILTFTRPPTWQISRRVGNKLSGTFLVIIYILILHSTSSHLKISPIRPIWKSITKITIVISSTTFTKTPHQSETLRLLAFETYLSPLANNQSLLAATPVITCHPMHQTAPYMPWWSNHATSTERRDVLYQDATLLSVPCNWLLVPRYHLYT